MVKWFEVQYAVVIILRESERLDLISELGNYNSFGGSIMSIEGYHVSRYLYVLGEVVKIEPGRLNITTPRSSRSRTSPPRIA
jgi:hypothetical protein